MDRRSFLLASAATLVLSRAQAQMNMQSMMGDGMRGMTGMGHKAVPLPEGATFRELPRLANQATGPGVFTATLTAAPGTAEFVPGLSTPILAYNGHSPGPLIEVNEGDQVALHFINNVGEDSTIHWHGLPVPAAQDGAAMAPVANGTDRIYSFTLPVGFSATCWYHPHPHMKTAEQVYRGLAGAFIVKPQHDPVPAPYGDTVLQITDLRLAADGSMPADSMIDQMNGRVGDHLLVNGLKNPVLEVAAGTRRRFRLLNTTNARFLRLSFGAAPFTLLGTDGGYLEASVPGQSEVFLPPASRLDVVVDFAEPGSYVLQTLEFDHGWMGPMRPSDAGQTLLSVKVNTTKATPLPPLPARLRDIENPGTPVLMRRLVLGESMGGMGKGGMGMGGRSMGGMGMGGMGMAMTINNRSFDMNRVDLTSKVGQLEMWEVQNPTDMDHPFHIHGNSFQLHEIVDLKTGATTPPPRKALVDIVNVPRGKAARLMVRQMLPGLRMYHCHILEHEDMGMMGLVDVRA